MKKKNWRQLKVSQTIKYMIKRYCSLCGLECKIEEIRTEYSVLYGKIRTKRCRISCPKFREPSYLESLVAPFKGLPDSFNHDDDIENILII